MRNVADLHEPHTPEEVLQEIANACGDFIEAHYHKGESMQWEVEIEKRAAVVLSASARHFAVSFSRRHRTRERS
jgi:hypothetical protein